MTAVAGTSAVLVRAQADTYAPGPPSWGVNTDVKALLQSGKNFGTQLTPGLGASALYVHCMYNIRYHCMRPPHCMYYLQRCTREHKYQPPAY